MADRPIAVQTFQVQSRRSRVVELMRVDAMANRRSIGRNVVGDELPEERPTRRIAAERGLVIVIRLTVAQSSGASERVEEGVVGGEMREIGKKPAVRRGCQPIVRRLPA